MSGLNRILAGELTEKKKKGKALVSELGKDFSPENILSRNSKLSSKDPDGDGQPYTEHKTKVGK